MHVYVCLDTYAHLCVFMQVSVPVCMHGACVHVCAPVCIHVYVCVYLPVCMHVCLSMYVCIYMCILFVHRCLVPVYLCYMHVVCA